MREEYFQAQINRLSSVYGKHAYPDERVKLIWGATGDLPEESFKGMVDNFIATERQSPMPVVFMERAQKERNRLTSIQDRDASSCDKEFKSSFSDIERKWMIEIILKRIHKGIRDEDWARFNKTLNAALGIS